MTHNPDPHVTEYHEIIDAYIPPTIYRPYYPPDETHHSSPSEIEESNQVVMDTDDSNKEATKLDTLQSEVTQRPPQIFKTDTRQSITLEVTQLREVPTTYKQDAPVSTSHNMDAW